MARSIPVLCDDGIVRRATFTAEADTFFSRPARVQVNGRTVSGSAYQSSAFYLSDGPEHRAIDYPVTAATLYYPDAPEVVMGIMRFGARGKNADAIAKGGAA